MKVWKNAEHLKLRVSGQITGGFDVGFDRAVPEATRDLLMRFAYWVEDHYPMPITLWVDFKYRHYLRNREKKPMDYLFYWAEFQNYPAFENPDDIPVIYLPVRMEGRQQGELLRAFATGITEYFAWLGGLDMGSFSPEAGEVEEILEAYRKENPDFP